MTSPLPARSSTRSERAATLISLRAHYELRDDPAEAGICVRTARTPHGAEMLPAHFEGWRITHDLLGNCAPRFADFDGSRIRTERIPGRPLHEHYAGLLNGETSQPLPWDALWVALAHVYDSGRRGPANSKLIPEMAWTTWFSIVRLRDAKRHAVTGAWKHPAWSIRAGKLMLGGKFSGGYSKPPAVTFEIAAASRSALTLGDMHMANLVGNADRIAFVDFSEVGHGAVALDLAPLWFEWWLARGLFRGDDGFVEGFSACWRRFVGPERLLVQMTGEWVGRAFEWLIYAFYADHLEIPPPLARGLTTAAARRFAGLRTAFSTANRLSELVTESA